MKPGSERVPATVVVRGPVHLSRTRPDSGALQPCNPSAATLEGRYGIGFRFESNPSRLRSSVPVTAILNPEVEDGSVERLKPDSRPALVS